MSGRSKPSQWKNRIYYFHFSVHQKCQYILFNISDVMMHLFRATTWIYFIMQGNDNFDKCLYIISFFLWSIVFWDFLGGNSVTYCSHWKIMGDGWLNIYWIYIVVYIYRGLCWEAHLMNCISRITFEAF